MEEDRAHVEEHVDGRLDKADVEVLVAAGDHVAAGLDGDGAGVANLSVADELERLEVDEADVANEVGGAGVVVTIANDGVLGLIADGASTILSNNENRMGGAG